MRLSRYDLFQMDDEWLKELPAELLLEVSKRLLHDVKKLQERLNRNPGNSSRPASTEAPWEKARQPAVENGAPVETGVAKTAEGSAPAQESAPAVTERPPPWKGSGKRPGRQAGSPGHGRTQKLAVTDSCAHRAENCAACGEALAEDAESQAYTAWDDIHRAAGRGQEMEGILTALMAAICAARIEPPPRTLPERYAAEVKQLRHLCEVHRTAGHPALRRVAREFLL